MFRITGDRKEKKKMEEESIITSDTMKELTNGRGDDDAEV